VNSTLEMPVVTPDAAGPTPAPKPSILRRAMQVMFRPNEAWTQISTEPGGVLDLFFPYGAVMALLPTLAFGLVTVLIGLGTTLLTGGRGGALFGVLTGAAVSTASVFIGAIVMNLLSAVAVTLLTPYFGGQRNWLLACRLVVYAQTPACLLALVGFIPLLGQLGLLLGILHTIYLLYLGLDRLLGCKNVSSRILFLVALLGLNLLLGFTVSAAGAKMASRIVKPVVPEVASSVASHYVREQMKNTVDMMKAMEEGVTEDGTKGAFSAEELAEMRKVRAELEKEMGKPQ
jgi:hypothetical protein